VTLLRALLPANEKLAKIILVKHAPAVTLGMVVVNKGNNKITEHRAIFQRER
jgi:hypothetical protein